MSTSSPARPHIALALASPVMVSAKLEPITCSMLVMVSPAASPPVETPPSTTITPAAALA